MAPLEVCAAVIRRGARLLLASRPPGSRLAGRWEFPGGKVSGAESLSECIRRELAEELGLAVEAGEVIDTVELPDHVPPARLHFVACSVAPGAEPRCREGQEARWLAPDEIAALDLLPPDRVFLERHGARLARPEEADASGPPGGTAGAALS